LPEATRALHRRHGVDHRITYASEDATALSMPGGSYDVVIFKSVIGALGSKERQQKAISEMLRVLRPGGVLLFAENLGGTRLHRWLRKRFVAWDAYWRYLSMPADRDLFNGFDHVEYRTHGLLANLGRSENQRDLLARIDAILCPLTPRSWHYIVYGFAIASSGHAYITPGE
jgi:SAM-dependent methyltransferase